MGLATDVFQQVAWSDGAQRWYWLSGSGNTGFVSVRVVQAEMAAHQEAMATTLETLTRQLFAGDMTVADWQAAVALEIKNASLAQSMFAVGGADNMAAAEFGRVGQMLREQYGYLDKFAQGVADGSITEGQAVVRVGMYADSTEAAYWDAWRANQESNPDIANLPLLEQSPRDGNTQCLTNCRCQLVPNEYGSVTWDDLGDASECDDCHAMAAGSPYRVN